MWQQSPHRAEQSGPPVLLLARRWGRTCRRTCRAAAAVMAAKFVHAKVPAWQQSGPQHSSCAGPQPTLAGSWRSAAAACPELPRLLHPYPTLVPPRLKNSCTPCPARSLAGLRVEQSQAPVPEETGRSLASATSAATPVGRQSTGGPRARQSRSHRACRRCNGWLRSTRATAWLRKPSEPSPGSVRYSAKLPQVRLVQGTRIKSSLPDVPA